MDINEVAIRYLASRSRTIKEMKEHLKGKGYSQDEILSEIDSLKLKKYLDDVSYTCEYLRYAFSKGKGMTKIKQELYQKGIEGEALSQGCYTFEDENGRDLLEIEKQVAYDEAAKTMNRVDLIDKKTISKLGRRLNSLGFKSDLIYEIVGEYMKEIKNEDYTY
ncbi:MAG: regulatory protein RecX [Anaerovoracaceae bacterium]